MSQGNDGAVALAKVRLRDPCEAVRFQAILALSQVANLGDESAVSAVCERVHDKSNFVKSQAIAALPRMLRKSDICALTALKAKLHKKNSTGNRTCKAHRLMTSWLHVISF